MLYLLGRLFGVDQLTQIFAILDEKLKINVVIPVDHVIAQAVNLCTASGPADISIEL